MVVAGATVPMLSRGMATIAIGATGTIITIVVIVTKATKMI